MEETFNELSTEHWERVLREAREMGAVQLGFSGGEPLLRKDRKKKRRGQILGRRINKKGTKK